ncbi:transglycosylase SLT domain-containing protein [Tepidiforma sp.]|uniref:transglycosylase SLT domain-containing protein n=1 Tax=Tepidiforma sp. TaxID=2682230 RepID=UPI002ADDCA16|nr:transglycosylase SLT domain-containing protein [Tepidiforma sp.]
MAIDPASGGVPSPLHVPLSEAGQHAKAIRGATFILPAAPAPAPPPPTAGRRAPGGGTAPAAAGRADPSLAHTPIAARESAADQDRWDALLNRLGQKYNVPPLFLKAVMLIESGGRPDAIGDNGHSVGLFQLHDQGYGAGMGDLRFDPEANADRAARGLAASWQAVTRAGYTGEYAVRAAYDDTFNPGGGFAHQGDALVRTYNELLARQGLPPLS